MLAFILTLFLVVAIVFGLLLGARTVFAPTPDWAKRPPEGWREAIRKDDALRRAQAEFNQTNQ